MGTKHCQILGMEDQKRVGYGCYLLQTSLGINYIFWLKTLALQNGLYRKMVSYFKNTERTLLHFIVNIFKDIEDLDFLQ